MIKLMRFFNFVEDYAQGWEKSEKEDLGTL